VQGDESKTPGPRGRLRPLLRSAVEASLLIAVAAGSVRGLSTALDLPVGDESHYHRLGLRWLAGDGAAVDLASSPPLPWLYGLLEQVTAAPTCDRLIPGLTVVLALALWWALRPLARGTGAAPAVAAVVASSSAALQLDRFQPVSSTFALGATLALLALGLWLRGRATWALVPLVLGLLTRPELGLPALAAGVVLWRRPGPGRSRRNGLGLTALAVLSLGAVLVHPGLSARTYEAVRLQYGVHAVAAGEDAAADPRARAAADLGAGGTLLGQAWGAPGALLEHLGRGAQRVPRSLGRHFDLGGWHGASGGALLGLLVLAGGSAGLWLLRHSAARSETGAADRAGPVRRAEPLAAVFLGNLAVAAANGGGEELLWPAVAVLAAGWTAGLAHLLQLVRERSRAPVRRITLVLGGVGWVACASWPWLSSAPHGRRAPQPTDPLAIQREAFDLLVANLPPGACRVLGTEVTQLLAWARRPEVTPVDLTDLGALGPLLGQPFAVLQEERDPDFALATPLLRGRASHHPGLLATLDGPQWVPVAYSDHAALFRRVR
jgi:hypothetical protein